MVCPPPRTLQASKPCLEVTQPQLQNSTLATKTQFQLHKLGLIQKPQLQKRGLNYKNGFGYKNNLNYRNGLHYKTTSTTEMTSTIRNNFSCRNDFNYRNDFSYINGFNYRNDFSYINNFNYRTQTQLHKQLQLQNLASTIETWPQLQKHDPQDEAQMNIPDGSSSLSS
jgi:hypothetical protein